MPGLPKSPGPDIMVEMEATSSWLEPQFHAAFIGGRETYPIPLVLILKKIIAQFQIQAGRAVVRDFLFFE